MYVFVQCVGVGVCAFVSWALWDGRGAEGGDGRAGLCALGLWAVVLTLGAIAALAGEVAFPGVYIVESPGPR